MKHSIKIVLKDQVKKDGTYPILIRVIIDRRPKYFSTGYAVKSSQFKDGLVIRHPDLVLINRAVEVKRASIAADIYKADIDHRKIDVEDLGKKRTKGTFLTALQERMNVFESNNQVASYNRLKAKRKIIKAAWGKDVRLSDLDRKWVDKYISYRLSMGSKNITVKKDLSVFSSVINNFEGYEGKDWFRMAQKKLKVEPVSKEKLSMSEIESLEKEKLYGVNDVARDMFLFAFYCQGMRFENVATFHERQIKNGIIKYRMNKGKKMREIQIHVKLQNIIDKYSGGEPYLFPIVKKKVTDNWSKKLLIDSANALINTHLKRVAVICGIEKNLSTHVARHSFAYLSLKRGVTIEILKDALGHTDFKTTQMYLKSFSEDEINESVIGLYD